MNARRTRRGETHGAHFRQDRVGGTSVAERIPHIGSDQSAGPNHPCHLPDTFGRVGKKVDHQRHDSRIEPPRIEGQRHGIPLHEYRAVCPRPCARECKLALRWIDTSDFDRRAAPHELLGESPIAAAHVEPALTSVRRQPIEEALSHELAPGAHQALISCSIIEPYGLARLWLFHCRNPLRNSLLPKLTTSSGETPSHSGAPSARLCRSSSSAHRHSRPWLRR